MTQKQPPPFNSTTIWREWRSTDDAEYARRLFNLVTEQPIGRGHRIAMITLGAFFGAMAGLLLDFTLLAPVDFPFLMWVGLIGGGLLAYWASEKLLMRRWLALFTPNGIKQWRIDQLGLFLVLAVALFFAPNIWVSGLALGIGVGMASGLALGLISWLPLWLISLLFNLGQVLNGDDIVLGLVAVGIGLGFGVLVGVRPNPKLEFDSRWLCVWWPRYPLVSDVIATLQQACDVRPRQAGVWQHLLRKVQADQPPRQSPESYLALLSSTQWDKRAAARYALITQGGEAVELLQKTARDSESPVQETALNLLAAIEEDTRVRLVEQMPEPLCMRCMLRCTEYVVQVSSESSFTYHGCRVCRQSMDIANGQAVAVLDSAMGEAWQQAGDQLRINWLQRREVFDFDSVEVVQATDEDIERFAVQVGNDTDIFRKPRYAQMACVITPGCNVSKNSQKVLKQMFGTVE